MAGRHLIIPTQRRDHRHKSVADLCISVLELVLIGYSARIVEYVRRRLHRADEATQHRVAIAEILASRVGGIPEIVEHETTGLLVGNAIEEIAAALRRFSTDRRLARECAERAFGLVEERFTDAIMVRQTEQIYRAVFSAGPPS